MASSPPTLRPFALPGQHLGYGPTFLFDSRRAKLMRDAEKWAVGDSEGGKMITACCIISLSIGVQTVSETEPHLHKPITAVCALARGRFRLRPRPSTGQCVGLLTEHPEAELLVALARLVPGDAGVLPLVQLGHLQDGHLRAVLVEAVFILCVQDHPVATTTGG